ncbi:MAG: hypothetical protein HYW57_04410 [Ignavibacteriales bacterium]|nr:hypothetical protein [Ignavibacteriales bacterium]
MRTRISKLGAFIGAVLTTASMTAVAQVQVMEQPVTLAERNLGGPRLGVTYVVGGGKLADELKRNGFGLLLSQFGWHFEYQVIPEGGGPQFVIQAVPLISGVEYSRIFPTATLAIGVRLPNGIEFGMGPNVLLADKPRTALTIAVGKSIDYGGVSIPINLAVTTNPEGQRVSLIVGYAIRGSARTQW